MDSAQHTSLVILIVFEVPGRSLCLEKSTDAFRHKTTQDNGGATISSQQAEQHCCSKQNDSVRDSPNMSQNGHVKDSATERSMELTAHRYHVKGLVTPIRNFDHNLAS